jgi:DNA-binding GntR family transcriptional regulator
LNAIESAREAALPPLSRTTLAEATADLLRERILAGAFAPGSRLVEAEIARQLRTSRAPVREAVAMLRAEGLAREEPGRGSFVAALTVRDIEEIYEVRAGLESAAARLLIERHDVAAMVELERSVEAMRQAAATTDRAGFVDADLALHGRLCQLSRNKRLLGAWENQAVLLRTLIRLETERLVETFEPTLSEHVDLVAQIRSEDIQGTTEACWALFRGTSRLLTESLSVSGAPSASDEWSATPAAAGI